MDRIEIRTNKQKLAFSIGLVLAIIVISTYFLFLTDQFPTTAKLFGSIANGVLVYFVLRPALKKIKDNNPELIADVVRLSYIKDGCRVEIKWTEIKYIDFKTFYDGYKIRKTLNFETVDGRREEIILNGLDFNWKDLTERLKAFKDRS